VAAESSRTDEKFIVVNLIASGLLINFVVWSIDYKRLSNPGYENNFFSFTGFIIF